MSRKRLFYLIAFIILLGIEILIALFVHDNLIRPYIGDMLVVMVIYMLIRTAMPDRIKHLIFYVFIFSAGVEIMQYFNIVELLGFGEIPFLSLLIGTVFDIRDIICYGAGCFILWILERIWKNQTKP